VTTNLRRAGLGRIRLPRPRKPATWTASRRSGVVGRDGAEPRAAAHRRVPRFRELVRAVRLLRRFAGRRRTLVVAGLLLVVEAATAVIGPVPIAFLIDFLQGTRPTFRAMGLPPLMSSVFLETIAVATAGLVAIAAVNSAADSLAEICFARAGRTMGYNLRVALYAQLRRLGMAFHDQRRTGDVLTRVTGDVTVLEEFIVKSASDLAGSLLVLTGSLAFLLARSWEVALVAVLVVPVLALISNHYSRRIKVATRRQRRHEGELASTTQEMLTSIRVVQSYGQADSGGREFAEQSAATRRAALEGAGIQARFSWVVAVLEALAIAAIVWIGLWLIEGSAITVGTLVLFILVTQNMFKPTRRIIKEWYQFGRVYASVERVADLLDREPDVRDAPDATPAPELGGRVRFDRVSFGYLADPVGNRSRKAPPLALHDVSFEVEPGEVFAIVGRSGAGKSTVAQLLPRLYDPYVGSVRIDGTDIRGYTLDSLRSQISLVLQDTILFSGTVADNIAYGLVDPTSEKISQAARLANAHEFIEQLPEGYATLLGERGANLSGGQRQRIAVARAFVRNPPILVLDEPTTGLDARSAQLVLEAIENLLAGKTTILISHDLNLIRRARRICVLDGGRVAELGTHAELRRADGPYAELLRRQFGGADPDEPGRPDDEPGRPDIAPTDEPGGRR
jgi:ABC-type multidrug transport system fused ATPase/permease subunit